MSYPPAKAHDYYQVYRQRHEEELKLRHKEYYAAHKEEEKQKARARYWAKKEKGRKLLEEVLRKKAWCQGNGQNGIGIENGPRIATLTRERLK